MSVAISQVFGLMAEKFFFNDFVAPHLDFASTIRVLHAVPSIMGADPHAYMEKLLKKHILSTFHEALLAFTHNNVQPHNPDPTWHVRQTLSNRTGDTVQSRAIHKFNVAIEKTAAELADEIETSGARILPRVNFRIVLRVKHMRTRDYYGNLYSALHFIRVLGIFPVTHIIRHVDVYLSFANGRLVIQGHEWKYVDFGVMTSQPPREEPQGNRGEVAWIDFDVAWHD